MNINTSKSNNVEQTINNVHSYSSITGHTYMNYTSTSTCYIDEGVDPVNKKKSTYTINLDWFQFDCTSSINGHAWERIYADRITVMKKQTSNNNPNFRYQCTVRLDNCEICEIFSDPIKWQRKSNEISVKISNPQLYTCTWPAKIQYVLMELGLTFCKLSRIDIALDGNDIHKKMDLFRRYFRTHTLLIHNDNLSIEPQKFKKNELTWSGYNIGSRKYQKWATIYDKYTEIIKSGKDYISKFWKINGLDIEEQIGRFELKLGYRHLKQFDFTSFSDFCNPEFIGKILWHEVKDWLKFYQVSLKDINTHKKSYAIKNGKHKPLIIWDQVPQVTTPLEMVIYEPNNECNAKCSITFAINEIQNGNDIESHIKFIENTTARYSLSNNTIKKIKHLQNEQPLEKSLRDLHDRLVLALTMNDVFGILE